VSGIDEYSPSLEAQLEAERRYSGLRPDQLERAAKQIHKDMLQKEQLKRIRKKKVARQDYKTNTRLYYTWTIPSYGSGSITSTSATDGWSW